MNSYELSRKWFNFCFENPEQIKPNHSALYFFAIEHCNRLGWKEKFGFPSQMVMEALGIRNWRTYSKTLIELESFGFIKIIEKSKNQYSSNIIALVKNTKANTKALDKALQKHDTKQGQSIDSIIKQYNKEQITYIKKVVDEVYDSFNKIDDNNIYIYPENDFLENWCKCRTHYLKKPTNIKRLHVQEKLDLNIALKDFSREEINSGMHGLFKQKNKNITSMYLKPKHFLENVDKYINAELSKDYELYGKETNNIKGGL